MWQAPETCDHRRWTAREKLPFVATVGRDVTRGKLSAGREVALSGKIYQGDMCCIVEMEWQPEGKKKEG